jgi:hypothetical protein
MSYKVIQSWNSFYYLKVQISTNYSIKKDEYFLFINVLFNFFLQIIETSWWKAGIFESFDNYNYSHKWDKSPKKEALIKALQKCYLANFLCFFYYYFLIYECLKNVRRKNSLTIK